MRARGMRPERTASAMIAWMRGTDLGVPSLDIGIDEEIGAGIDGHHYTLLQRIGVCHRAHFEIVAHHHADQ